MALLLNSLFRQFDILPSSVRLLRHQDGRADRGRTPYELWRDDRSSFEYYQTTQSPKNRARLQAEYWASFVVPTTGDTMLAGFYRCSYVGLNDADRQWTHTEGVDPVGTCDLYDLVLDQRFDDLHGRLIIDWGSSERAWIQRADNQNKVVLQIREAFREPGFPGFVKFIEPLSKLERLPATWVVALKSSRGVYLLTCPRTKEQYVGSAVGTDGFYGRWLSYVKNSHGGNVMLKSREPADYQVSILEVAGSSATSDEILAMEALWKRKFQSREMGLNKN